MSRDAPRLEPRSVPARTTPGVAGAAPAVLGALGLVLVWRAFLDGLWLTTPFLNDDYIFLDKVRGASFGSLWGYSGPTLGWWRPWSRELHLWVLERLFGTRPLPFHLVSLGLWLAIVAGYALLACRIAGARAGGVAAAGLFALSAWPVTLGWVSGAQDLWMLLLGLVALGAFAARRATLAALALGLALLSKETAVAWLGCAFGYAWIVDGDSPRRALRRVLPLGAVTLVWAALPPALGGRLWHRAALPGYPGINPGPLAVAARTVLSLVNLDAWPAPVRGWGPIMLQALPAVVALGLVAAWWARARDRSSVESADRGSRALRFGIWWAVCAWAPLFWPRIGWHGYYALAGAAGAWLALGALLAPRPLAATFGIAAMLVLHAAQADTPSLDWSTASYQRRAAEFMSFLRQDLARQHPAFPPHARLFFVEAPSHVGFMTDNGPSLRVWYGDSTLSGGFFDDYAPRDARDGTGSDYFFRYDSTAGFVELHTGPEDVARARAANPRWDRDHRTLAAMFARAHDWVAAGHEYRKLFEAEPDSLERALDAAVSFGMAGDTTAAQPLLRRVQAAPRSTPEERVAARKLGQELAR